MILLYLLDADGRQARLAGATGVAIGESMSPRAIDLGDPAGVGWPFAEAKRTETLQLVSSLTSRFARVPPGPWSDAPDTAVVVPLPSNQASDLAGFFVAGIGARLEFDDAYRGFLELATVQIATAVANARSHEEERRRADALAQLDRVKTAFFSNVSHEFRTPLSLLLGPTEDALSDTRDPVQRGRLDVVHRNALQLQKLVNTLLDVSRIEAGQLQAVYEPTDLSALTAELASNFRSAIEREGLTFTVECHSLAEAVFVDREMWEKVVLNLLSNAFKFALDGDIAVVLTQEENAAQLVVRDTGKGTSEKQLPHVFERFHRVEGARARTHEGTGIGLALVQELVKLHGGTVGVESAVGRGLHGYGTAGDGSPSARPHRGDSDARPQDPPG